MSENYTRKEQYLAAIAGEGTAPEPITREEQLLKKIAENGGGGGGTTNYNALSNKPTLEGVTLEGDMTFKDLDLMSGDEAAERFSSLETVVNVEHEQKFRDLQNEAAAIANVGAKNKFPNVKAGQTETSNGVTFTVNADGSVTINGKNTATEENQCFIALATVAQGAIKAGKYILSGVPEGYAGKMWVWGANIGENRTESDKLVTVATDQAAAWGISVAVGDTQFDNVTVYPMLRDASIADDTYVPYGKTNAEITAELSDTGWLTLQSGIQYRKKNSVVYVHVEFPQADIPSGAGTGWIGLNIGNLLPDGFRPSIVIRNAMGFRSLSDNQHKITMGQINVAGGIQYNAHNIGAVDSTLYNSIVADFCYPV